MRETKTCPICGTVFERPRTCGLPEWEHRRFCSQGCKAASQKGKPTWNKGMSFPDQPKHFIPCRICGRPTRYVGTERARLYTLMHCDDPSCVEQSRQLKNERISTKARQMYADGSRRKIDGWRNVSQVSSEETALTPWFESLGWEVQYRFNTEVHTNKLPRQFQIDFALPASHLYVEIDGKSHRLRKERDARRDAMMAERGWQGLRFPARLVREDLDAAKSAIMNWITEHLTSP